MARMPPPYDLTRGRGRGGHKGGNTRGGPPGGSRNNLRGGVVPYTGGFDQGDGCEQGHQNYSSNPFHNQQGFWNPNGNWMPNQPFNPYSNNDTNGFNPHHRSKQWNNPVSQIGPQQNISTDHTDNEVLINQLADLQTRYNKSQGQYLAQKDENELLSRDNAVLREANDELTDENAELRVRTESLIKNVEDFGKMMKGLEAKKTVFKKEVGKSRRMEDRERADSAAAVDQDAGINIKGNAAGKSKGTERSEDTMKPVPTKDQVRGVMKTSGEAMKALIEAGEKTEAETEETKEGETHVGDTQVAEEAEEKEWAPDEDEMDVGLVLDTGAEDEIDYDFDDLNDADEVEPVEVETKKRKGSGDEKVSVVEKKDAKRVRHRR